LIATSSEVARVDLGGAKILETVEASELGGDLGRGKEKPKGLARTFNPGRKRIVCEPFDGWKNVAWLPVIQSQAASRRLCGDETESGSEGSQGEVGNDPKPGKEGRRAVVETGIAKLRGERLAFKIDRCVREAIRNGDAIALK